MTRFRILALLAAALAVVTIVRLRPWAGPEHGADAAADPRLPPPLREGEGLLHVELEQLGHGSWSAVMRCEAQASGDLVLEPRRVRSSHEPMPVPLPTGTYRIVLDGMPRAGDRGWRNEASGRSVSTVEIRRGRETRVEIRRPDAAALILMLVDAEGASARPRSAEDGSRPDGLYLDAEGLAAAHEVVQFRPDEGSETFGTWSRWSLEIPDEVSGPVPSGDFTLSAVAHGRTLGRMPVKLVDGEIERVVLRVE